MTDLVEIATRFLGGSAHLDAILTAPVLDTFGKRRVEQEARRAGCSPSNITAAVAWAERYGVQSGITRAHQLADRQRPTFNPPPSCAA